MPTVDEMLGGTPDPPPIPAVLFTAASRMPWRKFFHRPRVHRAYRHHIGPDFSQAKEGCTARLALNFLAQLEGFARFHECATQGRTCL